MKVRTVIILVLVPILIGATLYLLTLRNATLPEAALVHMRDALDTYRIDADVIVDGARYRVSHGVVTGPDGDTPAPDAYARALRLAYASALAERAPILDATGVDPDILESAAAELSNVQLMLSAIQSTDEAEESVRDALFPIAFIGSLAESERARSVFLGHRDEANAHSYTTALSLAIDAYKSDLSRFKRAFKRMVPEDASGLGVAGGRILTRDSQLRAIAGLEEAERSMRTRLHERKQCLDGRVTSCTDTDLQLPIIAVQGADETPGSIDLAREIHALLVEATRSGDPKSTMPLPKKSVELSESACLGSSTENRIFHIRVQRSASEAWYSALTFVGDMFLIPSATYPGTPYFDYYTSNDVAYVPYWPVSTYTCPDLLRDSSTALSVLAIEETVPDRSSFVREREMADFLSSERVRLLAKDAPGSAAEHRYIRLALQYNTRSMALPDLLYRIASESRTNIHYVGSAYPVELGAPYLFFARSAFYSLFLGSNPSVSREYISLFADERVPEEKQPYITYREVRESIAREKLLHDVAYVIELEGAQF